jgi:hypothetical protein
MNAKEQAAKRWPVHPRGPEECKAAATALGYSRVGDTLARSCTTLTGTGPTRWPPTASTSAPTAAALPDTSRSY